MGTIVRGKIIRSDVAWWDGKTATATRVDATGGTVSGLQLNDYVDVLQVFGSGTNKTLGTVASATSHIGSTTCTLVFGPGTWTITDDITIGSNFTVYVAAGAVFSVSAGKTLTLSGPVLREAVTWTGGSGTVTNSLGSATLVDLQDTGGNYTATTVEAALAELASTSTGEGASIIGLEDSAGDFTATNVEAAIAEVFSDSLQNVSEDATPQLGGDLDGQGNEINSISGVFVDEAAAAAADVAADGQFWVLNETPNLPMFTNDAGADSIIDPAISEINEQNGDYTLVIGDKGKTIWKSTGGAGETITIPANGSVAFRGGTLVAIQNDGGGALTIAITTDTLTWANDNSTGSRTLADGGWAVIQKMSSTSWKIGGDGLS